MSHTNRTYPPPQFHCIVNEPNSSYGDPITQLNINTTQPWSSRSVQHQVPSPSMSTRTAMTAPDAWSYNRPDLQQASRSPIDNSIDPHLTALSMLNPSGHIGRSRYDPIARQFQGQDQPWSAGNLRSSNAIGIRSPLTQATVGYGDYRGGPGSEMGSSVLPSDSGYYSQPPQSVFSNEPSRGGQELPSGITLKVGSLNVESSPSEAPAMVPMPSDQISQISSRSGKSGKTFVCQKCGDTSKCQSDFKKHRLRHEKPFKCKEPRCKRAGQGFTTVNDLERHKKSVHGIGLGHKSYQCASQNCRNKEKIWPRLDNFKQHVERMHKDEDEDGLIRRSVMKEPPSVVESIAEAPLDKNLAVAGMEKSFSGNPAMDTVPMDLSLDHDPRRWPSPGQKLDQFANDMYPVSSHQGGLVAENGLAPSHEIEALHARSYIYQRPSDTTSRRDRQTVHASAEEQSLPNQPKPESRNQRPRPPLSNAPQTKAEQQRSTLEKQPRATAANAKALKSEAVDLETVDLEEFVLSIFHKATNSTSWDGLSPHPGKNIQVPNTSNARIKLTAQELSNLIKQNAGSGYVMQRRNTAKSLPNAKVCPLCDYAVARDCDLRKHMKRHERPYGCTYPKCHKRFGAKSDWKRHENSQHFQVEAFRCARPSYQSSTTRCGQLFYRKAGFTEHLNDHDGLSDADQRAKEVELCTIGKNCQGRFWCGFCMEVRGLKERQNAAWDERFDHIAHHFEKEKRRIEEWVCVEENRSKKESLKGAERDMLEEEEEGRDIDAIGEVDDEVQAPSLVVPAQMSIPRHASPLPPSQGLQQGRNKRQASEELPGQRRHKQRIASKYCCSCTDGPFSSLSVCVSCGHELCAACDVVEFMMSV